MGKGVSTAIFIMLVAVIGVVVIYLSSTQTKIQSPTEKQSEQIQEPIKSIEQPKTIQQIPHPEPITPTPTAQIEQHPIESKSGTTPVFFEKDGVKFEHYWPNSGSLGSDESEILVYNEGKQPVQITATDMIFLVDSKEYNQYSGTWEKFPSRASWDRIEYVNIHTNYYKGEPLILQPNQKGKIHYHYQFEGDIAQQQQAVKIKISYNYGEKPENIDLDLKRTGQQPQTSVFPSCGDKKEFFTVSHIPISELQNIVPLGNFNPPAHTFPTNHLYFHLKGFTGVSSSTASVVAPGDIWITRIGSSEYTMNGQQIKDYKMDFTVCKDVKGYFIHLTSLSAKLLNDFGQSSNCREYDTGGIRYKNCEKDFYSTPIFVAGGESIGAAGGSSDFGLADLRTPELVYANTNRWQEDPLHRVCPLDYFTGEVRPQLKSLLGSNEVKRTIEPICGEVAQDKPGTAQGVWFVKGTTSTYPEDPHIALAHDNIEPLKGVFSVGTSMSKTGLSSGAYYFNPKSSGLVNRDFKYVTADGNVYCYEPSDKFNNQRLPFTVIMQLSNPTRLIIEKQDSTNCGSGPWLFTSKYTEFER